MTLEHFLELGIALAVGLLIGFERQQSADPASSEDQLIAGARTFPLVALLGAVTTWLSTLFGTVLSVLAFVAVAALALVPYIDDVRHGRDRGVTSQVALLLTFVLGALATSRGVIEPFSERAVVLAGAAVIITFVLSLKPPLHGLARRVRRDDLYATLKFLIVAVVVLPMLPNRSYGPFDVLNPFKIGVVVAVIAGVDFIGFLAVRVLGPGRGLGLTGLVGGLASSTAVTLSVSGRAKYDRAMESSCALAVTLASTVLFPRVFVLIAVTYPALLARLWVPLLSMGVAGVAASFVLYRRSQQASATAPDIKVQNPFELRSAIKFGAFFTGVLLVSKLATHYFGAKGTYVAGVFAGTTDVDALTLSVAQLAKTGLSEQVAMVSIILAIASNTLTKAVIAIVLGGWRYGRQVLIAFLCVLSAGAVGAAIAWAL